MATVGVKGLKVNTFAAETKPHVFGQRRRCDVLVDIFMSVWITYLLTYLLDVRRSTR